MNAPADAPRFQVSLAGLIGSVAALALSIWLFRIDALLGIVGLVVLKHVVIAQLCQSLGVDRGKAGRTKRG